MSEQQPTGEPSANKSIPDGGAPEIPSDADIAMATIYGAVPLLVRRAYPDVTPRENEWAQLVLPGETWYTDTMRGVARVRAMREARRREPNLSEEAWWEYVDEVTPRLSEAEREDPDAILAAVRQRINVAIEILQRAPRKAERVEHGLTARQIHEARAQERRATLQPPTQPGVALRLRVSRSTLQRALKDLEMGRWSQLPPTAPKD
jgi:hypothetical protein